MTDPRIAQVLARTIDVPDFPKPGVVFKDLTPAFADAATFNGLVELFVEALAGRPIDAVVAIEARGFILGAALAQRLGVGFVPVRKAGKLPRATHAESYSLEYGDDRLELHADALQAGQRVVVIDDVLATGGTAAAAARLVERTGASVERFLFLLELGFLAGRSRLGDVPCSSLIRLA